MTKQYFNRERRKENMEKVVSQLQQVRGLDFNSLVFTFADIIHNSFLEGILLEQSKEERKETNEKILALHNALIDTLNQNSNNLMMDMIVLSNLLMDAVETATQRALEDSTK